MKINQIKSLFPILGIFMFIAMPSSRYAAIDWNSVSAWASIWLRSFLTFLVLGLLAIWIIPKPLNRWSEVVRRSPLKSLGSGILVVILGYVGIVLVFVLTLAFGIFLIVIKLNDLGSAILTLGLPAIGLLFGALNFIVAFLSKLVVIFFLGKILLESASPKALKHNFWPLLLGLVIYLLVRAIPWLGWAVGVIVTLVGLGAIWLGLSQPKAAVEMAVPPASENAVESAPAAEVPVQPAQVAVEEEILEKPQPADPVKAPDLVSLDQGEQPGEFSESPEIDSQAGD
jgi:hypothetical protein